MLCLLKHGRSARGDRKRGPPARLCRHSHGPRGRTKRQIKSPSTHYKCQDFRELRGPARARHPKKLREALSTQATCKTHPVAPCIALDSQVILSAQRGSSRCSIARSRRSRHNCWPLTFAEVRRGRGTMGSLPLGGQALLLGQPTLRVKLANTGFEDRRNGTLGLAGGRSTRRGNRKSAPATSPADRMAH